MHLGHTSTVSMVVSLPRHCTCSHMSIVFRVRTPNHCTWIHISQGLLHDPYPVPVHEVTCPQSTRWPWLPDPLPGITCPQAPGWTHLIRTFSCGHTSIVSRVTPTPGPVPVVIHPQTSGWPHHISPSTGDHMSTISRVTTPNRPTPGGHMSSFQVDTLPDPFPETTCLQVPGCPLPGAVLEVIYPSLYCDYPPRHCS